MSPPPALFWLFWLCLYVFACQGFALRRSVRRGMEFSLSAWLLPCQKAGIFSDRMVRCSPPDRSRRVEFFD